MKDKKHFIIIMLTFASCCFDIAAVQGQGEGITLQYKKALEMIQGV